MSHRHFDPSRDAAAALHSAWMQPGERLIRHSPDFGSVRYKVRRRTGDGTLIRHPFWWTLGWALISPFWLVMQIRDAMHGLIDGADDPPPVVFGERWDCLSARLADGEDYRTFWVMTDRRLALVSADPPGGVPQTTLARIGDFARELGEIATGGKHTLPVEPVWLRTVWQLHAGQFAHGGVVKRWWTGYDRVTFPDGSGIDFPR